MSNWRNYPPGASHLPRGDDEKYRKGHDRIFGRTTEPEPCPACGGRGVVEGVVGYVTREMAMDACEPSMEGMPYPGEVPCPHPECEGGFIMTQEASS